jgi:4-aminobutyrate aminotransferase-like enzyme
VNTTSSSPGTTLLARRRATLGPHSPVFYDDPLELVSGAGVWLRGADGVDYLDAYNNVPHVGHCNPAVTQAIAEQAGRLNINTRYLVEPVVDYAEALLSTFRPPLERVLFTNSGSESNDLALRIARQRTGHTGILVSDFSYHGNSSSLAHATTGLLVREPLGDHVRALRIPDLHDDLRPQSVVLAEALEQAAEAVRSLQAAGFGVSALLFDPLFSTEGLPGVPDGYVGALAAIVRRAGGLLIADEVQSGFGRSGSHFWGHQRYDIEPELVTLGKPMGNGHPLGGVVTTAELLDEFGSANNYFNTFAGNPVSAAAGMAVLRELEERGLQVSAHGMGVRAHELLAEAAGGWSGVKTIRGNGLFFGLEFVDQDGRPDGATAKWVVEDMRRRGVLISRIGRHGNMLKIRPPMVFENDHLDLLVHRLDASLDACEAVHAPPRV